MMGYLCGKSGREGGFMRMVEGVRVRCLVVCGGWQMIS